MKFKGKKSALLQAVWSCFFFFAILEALWFGKRIFQMICFCPDFISWLWFHVDRCFYRQRGFVYDEFSFFRQVVLVWFLFDEYRCWFYQFLKGALLPLEQLLIFSILTNQTVKQVLSSFSVKMLDLHKSFPLFLLRFLNNA